MSVLASFAASRRRHCGPPEGRALRWPRLICGRTAVGPSRTSSGSETASGQLASAGVARRSRPPGFDMTYRPTEEFFGPPWYQRVPSLLHLVLALGVIALVIVVQNGSRNTALYAYMFQEAHLLDAQVVAGLFLLSAVTSVLRSGMRGVRVRSDWVEYRDLVSSLIPKVRRIRWAQIDRIVLGEQLIIFELWDGTHDTLPGVRDHAALARVLERVAAFRAIPVSGGAGLDDWDELSGASDAEDET